jgi:hypothetical protein
VWVQAAPMAVDFAMRAPARASHEATEENASWCLAVHPVSCLGQLGGSPPPLTSEPAPPPRPHPRKVVTGFMEHSAAAAASPAAAADGARLAILPLGTGNDFCRSHGWWDPLNISASCCYKIHPMCFQVLNLRCPGHCNKGSKG